MTRVGRGCGPRAAAPGCRTMPSVLLVTVEQKRKQKIKNTEAPVVSKWCQRQILNAYLFIYVCIYLFVPFDSRSELYGRRRSVWSATSCYHFSKKKDKKNTDLTPPETDFTQLFRNCSNTKALWIFLLILLDVSEENRCFFPPSYIYFLSFQS